MGCVGKHSATVMVSSSNGAADSSRNARRQPPSAYTPEWSVDARRRAGHDRRQGFGCERRRDRMRTNISTMGGGPFAEPRFQWRNARPLTAKVAAGRAVARRGGETMGAHMRGHDHHVASWPGAGGGGAPFGRVVSNTYFRKNPTAFSASCVRMKPVMTFQTRRRSGWGGEAAVLGAGAGETGAARRRLGTEMRRVGRHQAACNAAQLVLGGPPVGVRSVRRAGVVGVAAGRVMRALHVVRRQQTHSESTSCSSEETRRRSVAAPTPLWR